MEDIRDIIEEKAVEKLKKSAFAKEHSGCLVVDAECQLPTEAQEGALCIVRKPESYIGRDALFVRTGSKWNFKCCGTVPNTTTYKGEVARMSDLLLMPEIGDFTKLEAGHFFITMVGMSLLKQKRRIAWGNLMKSEKS